MRSSLILITLAAGAAAQAQLTCPTDAIPPASVHKSTVLNIAARSAQRRGGVGLSPLDSAGVVAF